VSRTIVIGDVHGCARELDELLALVGPVAGDRVLFVGDLVARGPDSRAVVSCARRLGARSVLGNHEERLLGLRRDRLQGEPARAGPAHEALLASLSDEDFAYLDGLPLYLELPAHDLTIVHAGVLPGVPLAEQDAWTLTHIRSVAEDGSPSAEAGAEPWAASYRGAPHLAFGHDARRGLQLHAWATGLDTGCVYGGSLTAMVLGEREHVPFPSERRDLLISVRARAAYFRSG